MQDFVLLNKKIDALLCGYTNDSGEDCSEVAKLIKDNLHIGRLCTIRAFARVENNPGIYFHVKEMYRISEPYVYHTVLLYKHNNIEYIIDGTSDVHIKTLTQFKEMLRQCNTNSTVKMPIFGFYNGIVDEVFTLPMKTFKDKLMFIYK